MNAVDDRGHPGRRLLDRHLDGELEGNEAARFEAHLETCAACRREVRFFRALFRELRALPFPEVPAGFDGPILAAVLPRPSADAPIMRLAARAYAGLSAFLAAAAVTYFVLASIRGGSVQGSAASGLSQGIDSALAFLSGVGNTLLGLFLSVGNLAAPVLTALRPLANALEVTAEAVAPQVLPIALAGMLLASFVLYWAVQSNPERGVRHASLHL